MDEIELYFVDHEDIVKLAVPLCSRIAKSSTSHNYQVAERALYLWNNENFIKLTSNVVKEILPIVVVGIESNLSRHWSKSVQQMRSFLLFLDETSSGKEKSKRIGETNSRIGGVAASRQGVEAWPSNQNSIDETTRVARRATPLLALRLSVRRSSHWRFGNYWLLDLLEHFWTYSGLSGLTGRRAHFSAAERTHFGKNPVVCDRGVSSAGVSAGR